MLFRRRFAHAMAGLVLALAVAAGCLRTHGGGCGGPVVGEPCRCEGEAAPIAIDELADGEARPRVDEATPSGGTAIVHAEVEPPHLMYLLRPDSWCQNIVVHDVYEALLRRDPFPPHELGPELAESWEVSADGLELTFHLRRGVRWHDGEPFDADDVVFTFDTVRDPAVLAPTARANLEVVSAYEAPDAFTFRLRLREPSFYLLQHLEDLTIIPRHIFERGDFNAHPDLRRPVGTGPFEVAAFRPGREAVLERNDAYWGEPARLDRVVYRFAQDRTLGLQMLRRGDVDLMPRLTTAQVEQVRGDRELLRTHELRTFVAPGFTFLAYNTRRPQLEDRRVRQAVTMLIDRETMLCALEGCMGRLADGPYPAGHPGADPGLEPWPFDPARARALLDRAGWRLPRAGGVRRRDGRPLELTFLVPAVSTTMHRVATLMQQDLLRAGIRMDLQSVDWSVFLQRVQEHDFDLAGLQFTTDWETDLYVLYHSSQADGGMNYGAWRHDEADALLDGLRRELDPARRVRMQRRLHRILHEEVPHAFLFERVVSTLGRRELRNAVTGLPWYSERLWFIAPSERGPDGRPGR